MRPQYEKKYKMPKPTRRKKMMNMVYLVTILVVFEAIGLMLLVFPRSEVSELEKRELAKFPELTTESYFNGDYTEGISKWFSDTVPFRDQLMEMSYALRDLKGFSEGGSEIKLHGVGGTVQPESRPEQTSKPDVGEPDSKPVEDVTPDTETSESSAPDTETVETTESGNSQIEIPDEEAPNEHDAVDIKNNGVAVVGSGADTRALMLYGGSYTVGEAYAKVINQYKEALGDSVDVYSMVIPTAVEFYSPKELDAYSASQLDNINWVIENLSDDVKAVDVYTPLSQHTSEYIYTRTDHHWAALGAYYAAQKFAEVAGVPFMDISEYEQKIVRNYVGSMYTYSDYDPNVKNNPEDFIYYVPNNVDYTATYYEYILGEDGSITGMAEPDDGSYFWKYSDGSGLAYCTYMGGDSKIVHIKTDTANGRKLAIFKDSYGNAIPPYLFGSFEEIIVIDMRYFTYNAVDYLTENGITDVLFANNAFHAATASTVRYYEKFLTQ